MRIIISLSAVWVARLCSYARLSSVEIAGLEAAYERRVVLKDEDRPASGKRQIISIVLPGDIYRYAVGLD